jgi:hypothetical protein
MEESNIRNTILLGFMFALLGEITPNIRGITCGWNTTEITIKFYFDGVFSEDEQESMECIATEVIASIPDRNIDVECRRIDFPENLEPYKLSEWIYLRKE